MTADPTRIEGKITLANGQTVEFAITKEYGWQQWGNTDATLYEAMPLTEALTDAAMDHLVTVDEDA